MPVEMALWKMTAEGPHLLNTSPLDFEKRLEDMIVNDPSLIGLPIMVLGRQVPTDYGGFVDVLGIDLEGRVHVIELKRDRTPREVVAQILDYGSWAQGLTLSEISDVFADKIGGSFDEAFAERFGIAVPDTFNADQQMTVVASELDAASDRIVEYLASRYDVPLNAVFFRHFKDAGSEYLARTWLRPPEEAEAKRSGKGGKMRPWNGRDYYVILGTVDRYNRWPVSEKYGFVSAGGGPFYTKPLHNLAPGNRVFAYVGGAGYVAVGRVTDTAQRLAGLVVDGKHVLDQPDLPAWMREQAMAAEDDMTEWIVPVTWTHKRSLADAVWKKGLFASQVTVCKLRDERTIEYVSQAFGAELNGSQHALEESAHLLPADIGDGPETQGPAA